MRPFAYVKPVDVEAAVLAAAEELRARLGGGRNGGLDVDRLDVGERPHRPAVPVTSMIASRIPL